MTALELYIALQYDNNKVEAPSILVDEFVHFANKAQTQYQNKKYNLFASKQQLTDDLQAFTKTIIIDNTGKITTRLDKIIGSTSILKTDLGKAFKLPIDYVHLLGVVILFNDGCNTVKSARRLTSDIYGGIQSNSYLKPSKERPYFYIAENYLEIRTGTADWEHLTFDYLGKLDKIELTQETVDAYNETGVDKSMSLPYADYIAYEVLRELTSLILEMTSDSRLQTNPTITQSIN